MMLPPEDTDNFHVLPFSLNDAHTTAATPLYGDRLRRIAAVFRSAFPSESSAVRVASAPGRVNLIGEHIDYEGYSVLPMAIDRSICIAFASSPSSDGLDLELVHTSTAYPSTRLTLAASALHSLWHREDGADAIYSALRASSAVPSAAWVRYIICGYIAAVTCRPELRTRSLRLRAVVDGDVPPACGLSSSSALVVAAALALAASLDARSTSSTWSLRRAELAESCRLAELHVGTLGGGMDQAASCLARAGAALHVEFDPLRVTPVVLSPTSAVDAQSTGLFQFVVVSSMVQSAKAEEAVARFNRRVIECALAAKLIAKQSGLGDEIWREVARLADVQRHLEVAAERALDATELASIATLCCPKDEYNVSEIEALLQCSPLTQLFGGNSKLSRGAQSVLMSNGHGLKLRQRALHVWSEADLALSSMS
ncbi:hypothetical protein ATCC90586_004203 [Pythium insidiosum]|nr:hypothetical protein ATCC90586_004203 [Pythium insidiosum]